MADQDIKVSGPVKIEPSAKEFVALKLLEKIASDESRDTFKKDRKYWLTLYRQCWKAADGYGLEAILAEK